MGVTFFLSDMEKKKNLKFVYNDLDVQRVVAYFYNSSKRVDVFCYV